MLPLWKICLATRWNRTAFAWRRQAAISSRNFCPRHIQVHFWTEDQWDADHCRRDRGGMSECQGRKSNKSRGIQGRNKKPGLAHQERANMDRGLTPQQLRNSVHNTTYCCPKIRFLRQRLLEFSLNFGGNLSICCRIMTPRFSPAPWSLSCKKVFTLGPVLACEMFRAKTSQNHVHGIGSKNVVCFPSKANVWTGWSQLTIWQWYWDQGLNHKPAKVDVVPFNPLEFENHRIRGKCIPTHFFGVS